MPQKVDPKIDADRTTAVRSALKAQGSNTFKFAAITNACPGVPASAVRKVLHAERAAGKLYMHGVKRGAVYSTAKKAPVGASGGRGKGGTPGA
jgi:hypothetical protein